MNSSNQTRPSLLTIGTIALGIGVIAFSTPPLVKPRFFARLAGIPMPNDPAADVGIRSVALRDIVLGVELISAALHGGRLAPLLLTRVLCDGGDAIAVGVAALSGARDPKLLGLGAIAAAAAGVDAVLWFLAKCEEQANAAPTDAPSTPPARSR